MAIVESMGYGLRCDFPGCDTSTGDLGDYAFWGDVSHAIDEWVDSDGLHDKTLGTYCSEHVIWDEETDGWAPMQDTIETRIRFANQRIQQRIDRFERQALRRVDQRCEDMKRMAEARWWSRAIPLLPPRIILSLDVPF